MPGLAVTPFAPDQRRPARWQADLAAVLDPVRTVWQGAADKARSAGRGVAARLHGVRITLRSCEEASRDERSLRPTFLRTLVGAHQRDPAAARTLASDFRFDHRPSPADVAWVIRQLIALIESPTAPGPHPGAELFGAIVYNAYRGARRVEAEALMERCDRDFARDNLPVRLIPELLRVLSTPFPTPHEHYHRDVMTPIAGRCDPGLVAASAPGCRDRLYLLAAISRAAEVEQSRTRTLREDWVRDALRPVSFDLTPFDPSRKIRHSLRHSYTHAWQAAQLAGIIQELGQIRALNPLRLEALLDVILDALPFDRYLGILGALRDTDPLVAPLPADGAAATPVLFWKMLLQRGLVPAKLRNDPTRPAVAAAQAGTVRALLGNRQLCQALPNRKDPAILAVLAHIRSASLRASLMACLSPGLDPDQRLAVFDWLQQNLAVGHHGARRMPPFAMLRSAEEQLREGNSDRLVGLIGYYAALATGRHTMPLALELDNLPIDRFIKGVIGRLLGEQLIDGDSPVIDYAIRHVAPERCDPTTQQAALRHWRNEAGPCRAAVLAAWHRLRCNDPCYLQVVFSPFSDAGLAPPDPQAVARQLLQRKPEWPQSDAGMLRLTQRLGAYLQATHLAERLPRLRSIAVGVPGAFPGPHVESLVLFESAAGLIPDQDAAHLAPSAAALEAARHARILTMVAACAEAWSIADPEAAAAEAIRRARAYADGQDNAPLALERTAAWLTTAYRRLDRKPLGRLTGDLDAPGMQRLETLMLETWRQCAHVCPVPAAGEGAAIINSLDENDTALRFPALMRTRSTDRPLMFLSTLGDWYAYDGYRPEPDLMRWVHCPGHLELPEDQITAALEKLIGLLETIPDRGTRSLILRQFVSRAGRHVNADHFEHILTQLRIWGPPAPAPRPGPNVHDSGDPDHKGRAAVARAVPSSGLSADGTSFADLVAAIRSAAAPDRPALFTAEFFAGWIPRNDAPEAGPGPAPVRSAATPAEGKHR